jgi:hypothetical protein
LPLSLKREAVSITDELGGVVFVGAFAVNHYSQYRATRDIDLATTSPLDERKLLALGYSKVESRGVSWLTPRGVKVDFYTRDVGRIPVAWILDKSVSVQFGKKFYRVICLEGLVLAKHRAGRSTDVDDLRQLLTRRGDSIRWDVMEEIASPIEIAELRQIAQALS